MIAEGLSLALMAWCLSALALGFGVYLGGRALLDPNWAQALVGLKPDGPRGGGAEFRAVYGGVFLGSHLVGLALALNWIFSGAASLGAIAIGANAAISASWGGAAIARIVSMARDNPTRTRFNRLSTIIEIVMALLIGAPWIFWMLGLS
jgi:hypothetical protein